METRRGMEGIWERGDGGRRVGEEGRRQGEETRRGEDMKRKERREGGKGEGEDVEEERRRG